ncbi:hypothetical protein VTO42DRAFT_764 [Malbranchea cinnamomea]
MFGEFNRSKFHELLNTVPMIRGSFCMMDAVVRRISIPMALISATRPDGTTVGLVGRNSGLWFHISYWRPNLAARIAGIEGASKYLDEREENGLKHWIVPCSRDREMEMEISGNASVNPGFGGPDGFVPIADLVRPTTRTIDDGGRGPWCTFGVRVTGSRGRPRLAASCWGLRS